DTEVRRFVAVLLDRAKGRLGTESADGSHVVIPFMLLGPRPSRPRWPVASSAGDERPRTAINVTANSYGLSSQICRFRALNGSCYSKVGAFGNFGRVHFFPVYGLGAGSMAVD